MSKNSLKVFTLFCTVSAMLTFPMTTSIAKETSNEVKGTLITIPVTVTSAVENDIATMHLSVTRSGKNLTSVTSDATKAYNDAWSEFKTKRFTYKAKTIGPQTTTVWEKKKAGDTSEPVISGYRVTYRLVLTDISAKDASQLIALAGKHFVIESFDFEASDSQREKVTNLLLKKAIEQAQNRAKLIAQSLNKDSQKISYSAIDIHSAGHFRVNARQMKNTTLMSATDALPQMETGESETSVSITVTAKLP